MKKYLSKKIAKYNNIYLNKKHWKIIFYAREFYSIYGISPTTNMLIFFLNKKYNKSLININYLKKIFNNNPEKLINQISGLPKPIDCFK